MARSGNDLEARRQEARAVMEGEEHRLHRASTAEKLAKRRREAMLAMEGEVHRKKREVKERRTREQEEAARAKKEAEEKKLATGRTAAILTAEEKRRQEEAAAAAFEQRLTQITSAEQTIEDLKKELLGLSPLRTLKTDLAKAVKEKGISSARIVLAEQARRAKKPPTGAGKPKRSGLLLVGLLVVLLLGGGIFFFSWLQPRFFPTLPAFQTLLEDFFGLKLNGPGQPPPTSPVSPQPLIFAERATALEVDPASSRTEVLARLSTAAYNPQLPSQTINYLYFTQGGRLLTFSAFRQAVGLTLPDDLARSLREEFMFGVYQRNGRPTRFLLLVTTFFERSFSGLLKWEKSLVADLAPLLYAAPPSGWTLEQPFVDKVVKNKDGRMVQDEQGQTVLFYAFLDNEHLVITTDEETFSKIFQRFIAS